MCSGDIELIAEVILLSKGFENSKILAKKVVSIHSAVSEQFFQSSHYANQFGLRTVKTLLNNMASHKAQEIAKDELQILLQSAMEVYAPRFIGDDLQTFGSLLHELISINLDTRKGRSLSFTTRTDSRQAIQKELEAMNLQPVSAYVDKICQLHQALQTNRGIILVGNAGSGKSTCCQVLAKVMQQFGDDVHRTEIIPSILSHGALLGFYHAQTNDWVDGILTKMLRRFCIESLF